MNLPNVRTIHRRRNPASVSLQRVPTPEQLRQNAMRHLAAASLVGLAAAIVHQAGHIDQQWQYVAIAAALLPQVLIDALAFRDPERRARLRTSSHPALVPLLAACALVSGAALSYVSGGAPSPWVTSAAVCAGVGLVLAAAPVTVTFAGRSQFE